MTKLSVIIDLGNSQTRVLVESGEFEARMRHTDLLTLDNRLSEAFRFSKNQIDNSIYTPQNSLAFEVKDAPLGGTTVTKKVVHGELAQREYQMTFTGPDTLQPKYGNSHSLFNIIVALYRSLELVKKHNNIKDTIGELAPNVPIELTILLPPEQAVAQKTFKQDLMNIPEIHFAYPEDDVKFNIKRADIQQEGYTAFFGCIFDRRTKMPRKEFKSVVKKRVLVIDVGEGTTDLMLVDNMKALENSKRTLNIGGSNVVSRVRYLYSKENEKTFDRDSVLKAVLTGKLQVGNKEEDIVDYVNESKFTVAYKLVEEIKDYLVATQIPPTSINYVLVVGGGTLQAKNPEIESLGKYIGIHFNQLTPETDLLDVNKIDTNIDLFGKDELFTARTANLIGAGILTDIRNLNEMENKKKE